MAKTLAVGASGAPPLAEEIAREIMSLDGMAPALAALELSDSFDGAAFTAHVARVIGWRMKPAYVTGATGQPLPSIQELLDAPDISYRLKAALLRFREADALDALQDAELLVRVCRARLDAPPRGTWTDSD